MQENPAPSYHPSLQLAEYRICLSSFFTTHQYFPHPFPPNYVMNKSKWKGSLFSAKHLDFGFLPSWCLSPPWAVGFLMRTKIFWCFDSEEIWNINDQMGVMGKSGLWVNSACTSLLSQAWVPPAVLQRTVHLPHCFWDHKRIGREHWRSSQLWRQHFCPPRVQGLLSFKQTSIKISYPVSVKIRKSGETTERTSVKMSWAHWIRIWHIWEYYKHIWTDGADHSTLALPWCGLVRCKVTWDWSCREELRSG